MPLDERTIEAIMRVVAGTVGGRTLKGPSGVDARPTMDKVRGAIFNSLNSLAAINGATVVDLFAGTGALGIEAMSRGASTVTFVEKSVKNVALIRENLATLNLQGEVYTLDVLQFLDQHRLEQSRAFDIAFVDPPYVFDAWSELLQPLDANLVVCESNRPVEPELGYEVLRQKHYGGTHVTMLRRLVNKAEKDEMA